MKDKKKWTNPLGPIIVLFQNFELFSICLMISIETGCMYFIYLIIALYFPEKFFLDPTKIGVCYSLIGFCYFAGGIFGSFYARFIQKKFDFSGRMLIPVIIFLILAAGNFLVGFSLSDSETGFWETFSLVLICAGLRGFILPGWFFFLH